MKVGDLVVMKDWEEMDEAYGYLDGVVGIVVEEKDPFSVLSSQGCIGIMWADGGGIDYEPRDWLEVISETN